MESETALELGRVTQNLLFHSMIIHRLPFDDYLFKEICLLLFSLRYVLSNTKCYSLLLWPLIFYVSHKMLISA